MDQWDRAVTLFINTNLTFPGDSFWLFMSAVKVWIPLYVAVAALLMWRLGWKRGLIAIASIALCFYCDERICNLIKMLVERVRPCNDEEMLAAGLRVLENGNNWSFPSGHACNTFGLAVFTSLYFRKRFYSIFIYLWAALVVLPAQETHTGRCAQMGCPIRHIHYPVGGACGCQPHCRWQTLPYRYISWCSHRPDYGPCMGKAYPGAIPENQLLKNIKRNYGSIQTQSSGVRNR